MDFQTNKQTNKSCSNTKTKPLHSAAGENFTSNLCAAGDKKLSYFCAAGANFFVSQTNIPTNRTNKHKQTTTDRIAFKQTNKQEKSNKQTNKKNLGGPFKQTNKKNIGETFKQTCFFMKG